MTMKLGARGLDLVKRSEGLRLERYIDQVGKPTIGYGHLITTADEHAHRFLKPLSMEQAEDLLHTDVGAAERAVNELVHVALQQYQFDALVDFVFNLGREAFASSTLIKKLNAGHHHAVPGELARWNKGRDPRTKQLVEMPGLTRRRNREVALWNDQPIK